MYRQGEGVTFRCQTTDSQTCWDDPIFSISSGCHGHLQPDPQLRGQRHERTPRHILSLVDCSDSSVDVSPTGGNLAACQPKCMLGVLWLPNGTTAGVNMELLSQTHIP